MSALVLRALDITSLSHTVPIVKLREHQSIALFKQQVRLSGRLGRYAETLLMVLAAAVADSTNLTVPMVEVVWWLSAVRVLTWLSESSWRAVAPGSDGRKYLQRHAPLPSARGLQPADAWMRRARVRSATIHSKTVLVRTCAGILKTSEEEEGEGSK